MLRQFDTVQLISFFILQNCWRVWEWKSKSRYAMHEREIQIFKSEFFFSKKRTWKCHDFYLNYREVRKQRSLVLRFLNQFFVSAIKLLIFFPSCQIVIHLCFAGNALFQSLNLGFLSHSITIRNKRHFLTQIWRNKNQIQDKRFLTWKEKLNLVIVILFPLWKKNSFWLKLSKFSD